MEKKLLSKTKEASFSCYNLKGYIQNAQVLKLSKGHFLRHNQNFLNKTLDFSAMQMVLRTLKTMLQAGTDLEILGFTENKFSLLAKALLARFPA